jgi:hypothetical protein
MILRNFISIYRLSHYFFFIIKAIYANSNVPISNNSAMTNSDNNISTTASSTSIQPSQPWPFVLSTLPSLLANVPQLSSTLNSTPIQETSSNSINSNSNSLLPQNSLSMPQSIFTITNSSITNQSVANQSNSNSVELSSNSSSKLVDI